MKNLVCTAPLMEEVNNMRKAIEKNLISLLEEHNVKYIDCFIFGNTPIVIKGFKNSDSFTLDSIVRHKNSNGTYIEIESSNSYTSEYSLVEDIAIERLIDIYDWVKANEKELFEDVE
jgi:hypothetical protein